MKDPVWYRLEEESAPAYEAFRIYRDLGAARSFQKVATQLSKSMTLMKRWASNYDWGVRSREYDEYIDRAATRKSNDQLIRNKAKSRTQRIQASEVLLARSLQALVALGDPGADGKGWDVKDAIAGIRTAADQLRKDHDDEPTTPIGVDVTERKVIVYLPEKHGDSRDPATTREAGDLSRNGR